MLTRVARDNLTPLRLHSPPPNPPTAQILKLPHYPLADPAYSVSQAGISGSNRYPWPHHRVAWRQNNICPPALPGHRSPFPCFRYNPSLPTSIYSAQSRERGGIFGRSIVFGAQNPETESLFRFLRLRGITYMDREGREFSGNDAEPKRETAEMLFPRKRCCFCMPCFGSDRSSALGVHNWWNRMRPLENDDGWFGRGINALKKFREWSEILAGPRWKTFIRRFNRNKNGSPGGGGGKHGQFQYDALSYSLNFDEGPGQNYDFDEENGFRNFSSRFAAIPMLAKSSMDLGRDAPSFA